jgi:hypothetical protein
MRKTQVLSQLHDGICSPWEFFLTFKKSKTITSSISSYIRSVPSVKYMWQATENITSPLKPGLNSCELVSIVVSGQRDSVAYVMCKTQRL